MNWPNVLTGFGTVVMAIFIIIASCIAIITLNTDKESRREKQSSLLLNIWYQDKYYEKIDRLRDYIIKLRNNFLSERYPKDIIREGIIDNLSIIKTSNKYKGLINDLILIEKFIFKFNYFLEKDYINKKNIEMDFYDIFGPDEQQTRDLYELIRLCHKDFSEDYKGFIEPELKEKENIASLDDIFVIPNRSLRLIDVFLKK